MSNPTEQDEQFQTVDIEIGESSFPLIFLFAYYFMALATFFIHGWVTYRGWSEDGFLWGILYLFCFIYAELYWAYRAFQAEGFSLFVILSAIAGVWWIGLLIFRNRIRERILSE